MSPPRTGRGISQGHLPQDWVRTLWDAPGARHVTLWHKAWTISGSIFISLVDWEFLEGGRQYAAVCGTQQVPCNEAVAECVNELYS